MMNKRHPFHKVSAIQFILLDPLAKLLIFMMKCIHTHMLTSGTIDTTIPNVG